MSGSTSIRERVDKRRRWESRHIREGRHTSTVGAINVKSRGKPVVHSERVLTKIVVLSNDHRILTHRLNTIPDKTHENGYERVN